MAHKINDNGINRDMTADEETAYSAWLKDIENEETIRANALEAKAAARQAVLAKLGLSAEEATALLG